MMFSQSQFDNGFSSSQFTQFDSTPPAKSRDPQGTIPLTVKQISQASYSSTDDKSNFNIDGVDVTNVQLVGILFDKAEKNTDVSFSLDDGTGRIGCKRWPVIDFNEVTLHYVECIHQHIVNNKSQKGDTPQSQVMESSHSTPINQESNVLHSSAPNQVSMQMSVDGLKDVDQRVLDMLQQSSSLAQEKGVHSDEIARHLKLPVEKIMESITCLEDEGLIYSTIDEFHFKSTAA